LKTALGLRGRTSEVARIERNEQDGCFLIGSSDFAGDLGRGSILDSP
jgi:hypothetical protein